MPNVKNVHEQRKLLKMHQNATGPPWVDFTHRTLVMEVMEVMEVTELYLLVYQLVCLLATETTSVKSLSEVSILTKFQLAISSGVICVTVVCIIILHQLLFLFQEH